MGYEDYLHLGEDLFVCAVLREVEISVDATVEQDMSAVVQYQQMAACTMLAH